MPKNNISLYTTLPIEAKELLSKMQLELMQKYKRHVTKRELIIKMIEFAEENMKKFEKKFKR